MKRITIVLCLLIHFVYGQENKYLDSLLKAKSNFKLKINTLNDSIKNIDLAIATYKSKQLLKNISDSLITSTCKGNAKLKSNPTVTADIISIIKDGTRIIILDYIDNYFGVCTDSVCGYLNEMWVNKNEKIYDYMRLKEKEEAERDKLIEERKLLEFEQTRQEQENKYIKKYGQALYNKLKQGNYWLGMTSEMAMIALDYPEDINRTVGKWGVHEQWVYSSKKLYLYFENGKMTAFQD